MSDGTTRHDPTTDAREYREVELAAGDAIRVGEQIFTVVEIEADRIHLRVDPAPTLAAGPVDDSDARRGARLVALAR